MSEAGCEELEHKLETFVETVRQIGIIVHDFQPNSQTVLNRKLEEVVKGTGISLFFYRFFYENSSDLQKFIVFGNFLVDQACWVAQELALLERWRFFSSFFEYSHLRSKCFCLYWRVLTRLSQVEWWKLQWALFSALFLELKKINRE